MNMLNNYSITKITEYISGTIKKKNIMIIQQIYQFVSL